jgi:ribosome-binding factor A
MKFVISQVIQRELNDPRIGFITVLDVEPTEDVKEARVRVSVFGPAGARSKAEHALLGAKGFIQRELGRSLRTRNTPNLRFVFDDAQDKASRIGALIQKASQEDREITMAKKPSKKPNKPSRGGERADKSPLRKGAPGEDGDDEDGGGGEEASAYDAGAEGDAPEDDFASDVDEKKEEEAEEDYDEDFDEDYAEDDDDLDDDLEGDEDDEDEDEDDDEEEEYFEDEEDEER